MSVDQSTVIGNIQAQEQRVGPRQFLFSEAGEQWVIELAAIRFGTGTVDYTADGEESLFSSSAVAVDYVHSIGILAVARDAARMYLNLPPEQLVADQAADLRSYPVAMHLPVRTNVAKEAPLLSERERLPDLRREGAQGIDHGAPVNALL